MSVACLACRNRHIRCDATKPICKRCDEDGKECSYTRSRRGGLDRAALAARRDRLAKQSSSASPQDDTDMPVAEQQEPLPTDSNSSIPILPDLLSQPTNGSILTTAYQDLGYPSLARPLGQSASDIGTDPFIDLYYKCFHSFHPFVLPRHRLEMYLNEPSKAERLKPVISGIRHIGSLYGRSGQTSQFASEAANDIAEAKGASPSCPFLCQAQLLYSIVLFWSGDRLQSRDFLNDAIEIATNLGMSHQAFADTHSDGDPVLAESWRRTWWQIYIVDSNYAAIRRDTEFPTRDVPVTVDLPCEEKQYNSGVRIT